MKKKNNWKKYFKPLEAINPKNQKLVNKILKANAYYEHYNNLREAAYELEGGNIIKAYKEADKKCEKYFNQILELCDDLPSNQRRAILKHIEA
jgi:Mg/Co/Ni transporter MgtE